MKAFVLLLPLTLALISNMAMAESYKKRMEKQVYIEEYGGTRHETGVKTPRHQVEFGTTLDYQEAFDRAKKNAGTNKPAAVITGPAHKMHRVKSEARKQGVELIAE